MRQEDNRNSGNQCNVLYRRLTSTLNSGRWEEVLFARIAGVHEVQGGNCFYFLVGCGG